MTPARGLNHLRCAFAQTEAVHGLTWLQADEMAPLDEMWRGCWLVELRFGIFG